MTDSITDYASQHLCKVKLGNNNKRQLTGNRSMYCGFLMSETHPTE